MESDDPTDIDTDEKPCPDCLGTRLRIEARSVLVGGKSISEMSQMTAKNLSLFFKNIQFSKRELEVGGKIVKEIQARLSFLTQVGVDYLSLDRSSRTLSGGESQRIRLASQIGAGLIGILYVLDEPSIGLHPRDHALLLKTLRQLCELGNTILLVEHDEDTILSSDFIVDMGPGAGKHGGQILAQGDPQHIKSNSLSITGRFLSGVSKIPTPQVRRAGARARTDSCSAWRRHA
jgi:excinuclease ABC subunit A